MKQTIKACKFCGGRVNMEQHKLNNKVYNVGGCYWCGFRYTDDEVKELKAYKDNNEMRIRG